MSCCSPRAVTLYCFVALRTQNRRAIAWSFPHHLKVMLGRCCAPLCDAWYSHADKVMPVTCCKKNCIRHHFLPCRNSQISSTLQHWIVYIISDCRTISAWQFKCVWISFSRSHIVWIYAELSHIVWIYLNKSHIVWVPLNHPHTGGSRSLRLRRRTSGSDNLHRVAWFPSQPGCSQ